MPVSPMSDLRSELLDLLDAARKAIAGTGLAEGLRWLDDRRRIWSGSLWRVGVVGVTSAGKSMLLNGLLQSRLLPTGIRPSSNALVLCRKGQTPVARVAFQDGSVRSFDSEIPRHLREFGDERSNRGNELGVDEIEVEAPGFLLGESVLLVDTPGLDAFQHEDHETLTMERLVPTVDLVLFVTTTKSNADLQIEQWLRQTRARAKPVILVQNMADSAMAKVGFEASIMGR